MNKKSIVYLYLLNIFVWGTLSYFGQFCFEFTHSWSKWAIKEVCSCIHLETTKNCWVNFIWDFKFDIRLVSFISCNNLLFFLLWQRFGRDDLNILFFVENFTVVQIGFNCLFKIAKSTALNHSIQEIVGNLMIIIFCKTVDYLSLMSSFYCWIF